jgi:hypothetical protein
MTISPGYAIATLVPIEGETGSMAGSIRDRSSMSKASNIRGLSLESVRRNGTRVHIRTLMTRSFSQQ